MSVSVTPLESVDPYEVDRFLEAHEEALLYQSPRFLRFLKAILGCEDLSCVALHEKRIVGLLPLLARAGPRGKVYNSLPFFGSNGGVLSRHPEARDALLAEYAARLRTPGALAGTIVENPFSPPVNCNPVHNLKDTRVAQFTSLPPDASGFDTFFGRLDSSARRNARKASSEGVTVAAESAELAGLSDLHQAAMEANGGRCKPRRFFEELPRMFEPDRDFSIYVARREGRPVAALQVFFFNRTVEYYVPAVHPEYRSLQALPLILAGAMREAVMRGMRRWNWGGTWTTQEGVHRFKKKWAAEERLYSYHVQLNDTSILDWSADAILSAYPDFFVVPFSALRPRGSTA